MHARHGSIAVAALLATLCLSQASQVRAAWPTSPYTNLPIATATSYKTNLEAIPDGAGGAVIVWKDNRSGNADIYVQRVSASGAPMWTADGVALCSVTGEQANPTLSADGTGGAIVAWQDPRSGNPDIYAQRIDGNGIVQWTANGIGVCTNSGGQASPSIVADAAGGALIAWQDSRSGDDDIYGQRVDGSGVPQWTANGVHLCAATGSQASPVAVTDAAGGMIVGWQDARGASLDIYAQRVDGSGVPQWTADGVPVCTATGVQDLVAITTDGVGGALLAWRDQRSGAGADVYAGRVTSSGVPVLTTTGVAICTAIGSKTDVRIASDAVGGAYIAWSDQRDGPSSIYAQRMGGDGARHWISDGVLVESATGNQSKPQLSSAGSSGVTVCWIDARSGVADVYGQRLSASAALEWSASGVPISTVIGNQTNPAVAADGAGGVIVAWEDLRSGSSNDVYAAKIERFGMHGDPAPAITSVADVPNDQGGHVLLEWTRSYLDVYPDFGVDAYSIWRRAPSSAALDWTEGLPRGFGRSAVVQVTLEQGQAVYWEFVASLPARGLAGYSYVAPTTSDSIAGSNPYTSFLVMAERDGGTPYWTSAADSGYSVDDLAPDAPAMFAGNYDTGTTSMGWEANDESDLAGYRLYRGSDPNFEPGPGSFVAQVQSTAYIDEAGAPYVYKLTAIDAHGNESGPTTLVPGGVTAVIPRAAVSFALLPPEPNPARALAGTTLRFALPERGDVRVSIHDVSGRHVRDLGSETLAPGWHAVVFDGRDDAGRVLAPGLYLVSLRHGAQRATQRLLMVR